jgi:molybdenum cofactor cytidylyltransferase
MRTNSRTPVCNEPVICVAVLAAGQSVRFGSVDKLAQPMNGALLGHHICNSIRVLDTTYDFVITSVSDHPCSDGWRERGFEITVNQAAYKGLGTSVARAAELAAEKSADALLICLADMPFVPAAHLQQLIDAYDRASDSSIIASSNGSITLPPAIFGKQHFPSLANLTGDMGARELLSKAITVSIDSELLTDIDTVTALKQLTRFSGPFT